MSDEDACMLDQINILKSLFVGTSLIYNVKNLVPIEILNPQDDSNYSII